MSSYSTGDRVRATTSIHRSTGSAFSGDTGKVIKVTGDGCVIQWDNGGKTDIVKDHEISRA
jgi:ribosomal protein L21E